ncbi:Fic family protein [Marinobacter gelidimuriae]|uniref:Fic family protein n=1 Tax=Marinobacter gelidimuriae TaxID=2739064 RepID=UPI000369988B|nr:Fic family protein [Marinobacter gelidimuriae]
MTSKLAITPFTPQESALQQHGIFDLVTQLDRQAAKLTGMIPTQSADTIRCHMAVINSYYSNLIEGNRTLPHEIRAAQRGHYSDDPVKRDHQIESVAHIRVQKWIEGQELTLKTVCSTAFILTLHRRFYEGLPESLRQLRDENEIVAMVEPGQWRQQNVKVGRHVPPDAKGLASLMEGFCDEYRSARYPGNSRLIGLACAHHRFLWIHPFMDGNGRVVRLWTDALFRAEGLESYGIWSLSRGLARQSSDYKAALAQADYPMQGTNDGRGPLSQERLTLFCKFMLETALDQVNYMSDMLALDGLLTRIRGYIDARNDGRVPGMTGKYKPVTALLLYNAFLAGSLERADAIDLTGMPERSARRLLAQLKEEGLLSETSSRSPLKWEIPEHAEPFYFPQLAPGA